MPDIRINALATTAAAPAPDDFLELDGATNGGRKLRANALQEWDSTRPAGGYLYSDGATPNRGMIQTGGARINLSGALVVTWVGWFDVPTSNISTDYQIFSITNAVSGNPWAASSLYANIAPAGHLQISQINTSLSNSRTSSFTNFRSTYSGQRIWLKVRFTRGTSKPVVYVNGVNVTASFNESATATAPDWLDTSTPSTFFLTGVNWPAGIAPLGQWLNAHLTDAESEAWRITGRPPAWVAAGGSRVATYTSNFSVDADGWTEIAGGQSVLTGNIDAVSGVDDTLRISRGTTGVIQIQQPTFLSTAQGVGQGFELIFDYFLDSASGITSFYLGGVGSPQSNSITPVEGAWQTGVRLATNLYTAPRYIAANGALATGKNLYFKNIVLRRTGALSLPAVQPVPVVRDLTTLGGNQARLVGMTPIPGTEASPFTFIEVPATAFTAGTWTQILGGVLLGGRRQRIVSISGNSSANTTLDVGTNGSTATLVSAQTTNGDFDIGTFAGRIVPASSSLWLRFAGATTANVTIQLAPA